MHQPGMFEWLTNLYAHGEQLIREGRLEEAVAYFSQGLGVDDHFRQRYVTMYAQRAFALHRLGRFEEAAADYARAIAMEPPHNQGQYHLQRAMCLRQLGRDDEALFDFTRATELTPDQPGPWHLRGRLHIDHQRWSAAIADFDRLLALRQHPDGLLRRGFAKMSLQDYAGAVGDVVAGLATASDPWGHYLAAGCFAALGQPEPMVEHAARAVADDPSYRQYILEDSEFANYRAYPPLLAAIGAG